MVEAVLIEFKVTLDIRYFMEENNARHHWQLSFGATSVI
jgi:hypothetical protein